MEQMIVIKFLIILPIVTGFGMALKEFNEEVLPNEYIPFILPLFVGIPLALLIEFLPGIALPITQGLLLGFTGVFGHKVYKYLTKNNNE